MEFSRLIGSWGLQANASVYVHVCEVCSRSFVDRYAFEVHRCLRVIRLAGDLEAHESRHPLECVVCRQTFDSKELMLEHTEVDCGEQQRSPRKAKKLVVVEWLLA